MLPVLGQIINPAPRVTPASNDALKRMVEAIPNGESVDKKRCLFDSLDDAHRFSVPSWMTDQELTAIWRHIMADHKAGKFDAEDLGKTDSQLRAEYRVIAERRVRLGLVLKAIARGNDIRLSNEEIAAVRATGYRGTLDAILELKIVEFIFGLAGRTPE